MSDRNVDSIQLTEVNTTLCVGCLVRNIEDTIILLGDSLGNDNIEFAEYFSDVFVDCDRATILNCLTPRLRKLASLELSGQQNCFLMLGPRGIGKTKFLIALGQWFTAVAGSKGIFIYRDTKDESHPFNFGEPLLSLANALQLCISKLGISISDSWSSVKDCWDWLLANNKVIFLVLDEFDEVYNRPGCTRFLHDLALLGGRDGLRPIMVIISGSAAVLRLLCYRKVPDDVVTDYYNKYPSYRSAPSFNSTKYLPLLLGPIRTITDLSQALAALKLNETQNDVESRAVLMDCSGQIRQIIDRDTCFPLPIGSKSNFSDGENSKILMLYMEHITLKNQQLVIDLISRKTDYLDHMLQDLKCPINIFTDNCISLGAIYNCMDCSFIRLIDSDHVCITHQSYLETVFFYCVKLHNPEILTAPEKLCLQYAFNSGADEINELFVAESLCAHGLQVPNLGLLRFKLSVKNDLDHAVTGVTRSTGHSLYVESGLNTLLTSHSSVGSYRSYHLKAADIQPAQLFKEYPDETGADLIAAFHVHHKSTKLRGKWIIVRVQIKLGLSKAHVDSSQESAIQWMKQHESLLLSGMGKTSADVIFVTVLWTSRPTYSQADAKKYVVIIDSKSMKWVSRVQKFVDEARLVPYGAN